MDVKVLDDLQTSEYWDQRYAREEGTSYDWFKSFDDIKDVILPHVPLREARILELGCGNSTITPGLHDAGYANLTAIDFSSTLVKQMQQRYPGVNFQCMDIREMLEPAQLDSIGPIGSYDLVIDKGTLDALVAEKGSVWDPSEHVRANARKEIDAVIALLKPGGTFLYMTWQQKQFRLMFLERPGWDVTVHTVQTAGGQGWDYYLFVAKKHATA